MWVPCTCAPGEPSRALKARNLSFIGQVSSKAARSDLTGSGSPHRRWRRPLALSGQVAYK